MSEKPTGVFPSFEWIDYSDEYHGVSYVTSRNSLMKLETNQVQLIATKTLNYVIVICCIKYTSVYPYFLFIR